MSHLAVYLQDCDDDARKAEMIQATSGTSCIGRLPWCQASPVDIVADQHPLTIGCALLQCLQALPQQTLMHAAQNLKKRAFWLNAEEAAELEAGVYRC